MENHRARSSASWLPWRPLKQTYYEKEVLRQVWKIGILMYENIFILNIFQVNLFSAIYKNCCVFTLKKPFVSSLKIKTLIFYREKMCWSLNRKALISIVIFNMNLNPTLVAQILPGNVTSQNLTHSVDSDLLGNIFFNIYY